VAEWWFYRMLCCVAESHYYVHKNKSRPITYRPVDLQESSSQQWEKADRVRHQGIVKIPIRRPVSLIM